MEKPEFIVTTARAADILGCSTTTVTRLIRDGALQAYKLNPTTKNSPWRIYRSSIDHVLQMRQPQQTHPTPTPAQR